MRHWFIRLLVFVTACGFEIDDPKSPVVGFCAPGAHYACPCEGEPNDSGYLSGKQGCGPDYHVTSCECDGGDNP